MHFNMARSGLGRRLAVTATPTLGIKSSSSTYKLSSTEFIPILQHFYDQHSTVTVLKDWAAWVNTNDKSWLPQCIKQLQAQCLANSEVKETPRE